MLNICFRCWTIKYVSDIRSKLWCTHSVFKLASVGICILFLTCDALRDLIPFVQFTKHEKHSWRSVIFSKLKVTLLHRYFSRFLNCTNGTKSRKAPYMITLHILILPSHKTYIESTWDVQKMSRKPFEGFMYVQFTSCVQGVGIDGRGFLTPYFIKTPYIAYTPLFSNFVYPFFLVAFNLKPHCSFYFVPWLTGWSWHIWCVILLNDIMDLNESGLDTLAP